MNKIRKIFKKFNHIKLPQVFTEKKLCRPNRGFVVTLDILLQILTYENERKKVDYTEARELVNSAT